MKNDNIIKETESGYYYEGYLGTTAWRGNKSDKSLYGSELSKAIRDDLKKAGIKNVSVKIDTFSGGQHLYLTLKATPSDYVSKEEFIKNYDINKAMNGEIRYGESYTDTIRINDFCKLPAEEQKEKLDYHKNYMYDYLRREDKLDAEARYSEDIFAKDFQQKIERIQAVVNAYNHEDINGMADYFHTNFYASYDVKPTEPYITKQDRDNEDIDDFINSFDSDITGNTNSEISNEER